MRRLRSAAPILALLAACGGSDSTDPGGDGGGTPPPPAFRPPSDVAGVPVSISAVRLTWSTVAGATAYVVQRTASGAAATRAGLVTTPAFADSGLRAGTSYQYQVAAVRGTDTSAFSAPATVATRAIGAAQAVLRGEITAARTLTPETTYVLSGFVKVRPGATLTIQAGTRLVGDSAVAGSLLMITRGARIDARGTPELPIVLGSQRAAGSRAPGDWGGLVIAGAAPTSRAAVGARTMGVTGSATQAPEPYGGTTPGDDSGVLRYVRIEFAGAEVPTGSEQLPASVPALALYAVGRGTTIEYVQALGSLGSAFQWTGGTVDGRHLVSYESGDDHFSWSDGYVGRNQFLVGFQSREPVPRAGAGLVSATPRGFQGYGCDPNPPVPEGCTTFTQAPLSSPVFANFTIVGPGSPGFAALQAQQQSHGLMVRRGSGGTFVNGVVARWQGQGLSVRESATDTLRQRDSLYVGAVLLTDNQLGPFDALGGAGFGTAANFPGAVAGTTAAATLFAALPAGAPTLDAIDWTPTALLRTGGLAAFPARVLARTAGWFGGTLPTTAYRGAAAPDGPRWWLGWTAYARD